jgi:UDP-N-acetylmuramate: L-alanyl-gamma-D-glutamyl-meso-diaminopimelate ligase
MHNLAIALHKKGYQVSGSDDEIFEPSRSRLDQYQLLPKKMGWDPKRITPDLDAIILGMHARKDNPELERAQELGLKVYSYPEYLYEQTKHKKRIVIGGSHGKTTITSMVMHVLRHVGMDFDYMVGAQLEGFETMVGLHPATELAIFEGDEYLSSPLDLTPKFHWYRPHVALLSGIAWDHINVFPTWENYLEQFALFAHKIEDEGSLIYYSGDQELEKIANQQDKRIKTLAYKAFQYEAKGDATIIKYEGSEYKMQVFGAHNMQNMNGARLVCREIGIQDEVFLQAMTSFKGAAKRLQLLTSNESCQMYLDFAHSPSKLKATTEAVKSQFPQRELVACMELHTFSSLNRDFLPLYKHTMNAADKAMVYFNPEVIKHKKLPDISVDLVARCFDHPALQVYTSSEKLLEELQCLNWENRNLLIMTSGNLSGVDLKKMARQLISS